MPNKVYTQTETAQVFTDAGGDVVFDLGGLAADGVRVSAQLDLGAAPRADRYEWRLIIDGFDTAPVVGESCDCYLATSDGTYTDADVSGDGAGSVDDLPNLMYLGSAIVQTTTAGDDLVVSGVVEIVARYVNAVVHNNTADALLSTADAHKFILTPVPPEVQ